jgi:hypothetical protein
MWILWKPEFVSNSPIRFPPGVKRPPLGNRDELPAPIIEYFDKFERVKEQYLGKRRYWYLNLIGRHPERREPGM